MSEVIGLATLLLTLDELDALAVAVAKGVCPDHVITPPTATTAARVIWAHRAEAGMPLCGLATLLAEAAEGLR